MSSAMRAKVRLNSVEQFDQSQRLNFSAVSASQYPEDGSDENNTYARFTPQAEFQILVLNPALQNKFKVGEEYYVDFTPTA